MQLNLKKVTIRDCSKKFNAKILLSIKITKTHISNYKLEKHIFVIKIAL